MSTPPATESSPSEQALDRSQLAPWRFEQEVAGLVARTPRGHHPVVFIGSSSFTIWFTLDADLGHIGAINHGFGGCMISDCIYFWDQLVVPYSPRFVVLGAGDNDLGSGKAVETVISDFEIAASRTYAPLPKAKLLFVAIKPSIARWNLFPAQTRVNDHVRARAERDARIGFIDICPVMLGADGRPRAELFLDDGLHLSAEGYKAWTSVLRPRMQAELGR